MSVIEKEIRKMKSEFRNEIAGLRKLIVTRLLTDKWVHQDVACALLHVGPRQLARIRVHIDKDKKKIGCIGWKKSNGKNTMYYLPDIEKYNSAFTIMN